MTESRLHKRLAERVGAFMRREGLWPEEGPLLLAVSGGPDSTALVLLLDGLARVRGTALAAAHFDHGLRGEEASLAERSAVRRLASERGLSLLEGAGDVAGLARREHLSIEDAARQQRYAFLMEAARNTGAGRVATGHTASDQAETVLLHLLRGSGLEGLGGMAPLAPVPIAGGAGVSLVRPLLVLTRSETEALCRAEGIQPVEDESNTSPRFRRNRVRQELLPLLEGFNPAIEQALVRLAGAAREDVSFLDSVVAPLLRTEEGAARIPPSGLHDLHPAPRRHLLRSAFAAVAGSLDRLSERHVAALEALALHGKTGDRLDLPQGLVALREREDLVLTVGADDGEPALPAEPARLPVPGEARCGHLLVRALPAASDLPSDWTAVKVDAEAAGDHLLVRRRRPGERMRPAGLDGTRKLQDVLVDAHVPRARRDAVPVFEGREGILWVGGVKLSEAARPRPGRPVVVLAFGLA